ncbi:MAG: EAL domain-containing protein [Chloroflexota bacterium]
MSAALLGLALIAGGITVVRFGDQSAAEADGRLDDFAEAGARDLGALFAEASRDLRLTRQNSTFEVALGTGREITAPNRQLIETSISYVANRYRVDEICLIRSSGLETARWNDGRVAPVSQLSPDESGNPFFRPAMHLPNDSVFVTDPYISPDSGRWVYGFATPIMLASGVRTGVLHFEIPVQRLTDIMAAERFGAHGYTAVIDRSGRLLAHPDLTRFRTDAGLATDMNTAPFPEAVGGGTAGWRSAVRTALDDGSGAGTVTFDDDAGQSRLAYRAVPDTNLVVLSVSPTSELYADVARTRLNLIATAGPLVLLMVALSAWFATRLSRTNRRLASASLASSQLASIVESADDAILSVRPDGRIATWNDGAQAMYGLTSDEVVGERLDVLFAEHHTDELPKLLEAVVVGELVERRETLHRTSDGSTFHVWLTFSPIRDASEEVIGVSVIARNISDRKRLEDELAHQALHDSLTGLPNRVLFHDRLRQSLHPRRTERPGMGRHGVLFVDLDDFKIINDTLGHRIGDQLLISVATRLRQTLRGADTAARLGGDEFTILLEDMTTDVDAERAAERILDELRRPFELDGHHIVVSASIGIAYATAGRDDPADVMRSADTALYEAKGQGKGRHETYKQTMNVRAWRRLELESELRRAIARNEFVVHYQPIVELQTGEIAEVEALVRWEHPVRGLVPPAEFIPLAEQTGIILPLGDFVLETACRQLAEWQRRIPRARVLSVSVNVSARQLVQPGFVESTAAVLARNGLESRRLNLEITESATLEGDTARDALYALRELGIRMSIDDFGTGYSSLGYFRNLAIGGLKIDRAFVDGLGTEREDTAIVTAAIAFGHALEVEVVGEGIETQEQLDRLRDLGCALGQGFLFSKAVPPDEVVELLRLPAKPGGVTKIARRPIPPAFGEQAPATG